MGKRLNMHTISLQAGVLILLLGLQLRAVETFELSAPTTRLLAGMVGPSPATAHGAVRQIVIDTTQPRHRVTPPNWLGWSMVSIGCVLTVHGLWHRK